MPIFSFSKETSPATSMAKLLSLVIKKTKIKWIKWILRSRKCNNRISWFNPFIIKKCQEERSRTWYPLQFCGMLKKICYIPPLSQNSSSLTRFLNFTMYEVLGFGGIKRSPSCVRSAKAALKTPSSSSWLWWNLRKKSLGASVEKTWRDRDPCLHPWCSGTLLSGPSGTPLQTNAGPVWLVSIAASHMWQNRRARSNRYIVNRRLGVCVCVHVCSQNMYRFTQIYRCIYIFIYVYIHCMLHTLQILEYTEDNKMDAWWYWRIFIYDVCSHVLWCLPRIPSVKSSQILLHTSVCFNLWNFRDSWNLFCRILTYKKALFINLLGELKLEATGFESQAAFPSCTRASKDSAPPLQAAQLPKWSTSDRLNLSKSRSTPPKQQARCC